MRTCKGMDCEGEIMMIQRLRWLWRHPEDTKKHSSPSWILYESLRRIFFGVWFLLPPPKKQIFSNLDLREFVLLFLFKILFGVSAGREAIWYRQIVFFLSALCHLPFSRSFFQGPYSSMRCFSFPFLFFFWVCHLAIFSFFLSIHCLVFTWRARKFVAHGRSWLLSYSHDLCFCLPFRFMPLFSHLPGVCFLLLLKSAVSAVFTILSCYSGRPHNVLI